MIRATFYKEGDLLKGFEIKGHSGYADEGEDVICATVSSAAYMAANTVTEIIDSAVIIGSEIFRFLIIKKPHNLPMGMPV